MQGDDFLLLQGFGDGAAVDKGYVPRYSMFVLDHAAVHICVALKWAACFF